MKRALFALTAFVICLASAATALIKPVYADGIEIKSRGAYLIDFDSGTVLYEKDAAAKRPIASMVKIMTLLLCLEEVEKGTFSTDDSICISSNAASMGGSQAFLDANQNYKIDDLIKTITIASANDSCVAMAEHISGSVESFVDRMNSRAAELDMQDTLFVNCTGLPAPNQYSTAKDVAIMTRALLKHNLYFKYSTIWLDSLKHASGRETELANTNKLIRAYEGCDGGKTGFTNDAMFCLSSTAKRGSMRLISVIIGGPDSKTRFFENSKLLNYGFANFENKQIIFKGKEIEKEVFVAKGKPSTVRACAKDDFFVFGAKGSIKNSYSVEEQITDAKAPLKKGDVLGRLIINKDGQKVGEVEVVAASDIGRIGYNDILNGIFRDLANID